MFTVPISKKKNLLRGGDGVFVKGGAAAMVVQILPRLVDTRLRPVPSALLSHVTAFHVQIKTGEENVANSRGGLCLNVGAEMEIVGALA